MNVETNVEMRESIKRLTRDVVKAGALLGEQEARFLVDAYYITQAQRIRSDNQIRSMGEEPTELLEWISTSSTVIEGQIKRVLKAYADASPLGQWAQSIIGIGPVLSAGLLAHIDLNQAPAAGHLWSFAGLSTHQEWKKGQKRPWNASLKTLCWKIGESFVKSKSNPKSFYGPIFDQEKARLIEINERGGFAVAANDTLERKTYRKTTEAYKAYVKGKLPPAHIHSRARRFTVKLFLSHYHEAGYKLVLKKEPPEPYAIAHLGHVHKIACPNL